MAAVVSNRRRYTMKELKTLGHQLLTSKAHTNNAPILISFLSSSPRPPLKHAVEALLTLQSFFTPLLPRIPSSSSSIREASESLKRRNEGEDAESIYIAESIYKDWLKIKFDDFINVLIDIIISSQSEEEEEQTLRDVALDALMEFVRQGRGGRFQSGIYYRFLRTIVYSPFSVDLLLDLLASKYFKYIDLRYLTYISLGKLARSCDSERSSGKNLEHPQDGDRHIFVSSNKESVIHKIYGIFSRIPPLEGHDAEADYEMWSQSGQSKEASCKLSKATLMEDEFNKSWKSDDNVLSILFVTKKMKSRMSRAWLSFLRLPLPLDVYKKVLSSLHQSVIPYMANPVLLSDFLTRSYDFGGVISVMALSSLHILMTQHGLEYPHFYEKLYALLVPTIFMAKHRAKFFQLLDSCLKSTLVPAYLAAAFAKKLSRLALSAPPSGALVIIAIIHNLLRRHPSINCLVHRVIDDATNGDGSIEAKEIDENVRESDASEDMYGRKSGVDLFMSNEHDPAKANAMSSSLWEVETLRHHYCPAVSRFVLSLENDLTVRAKTTEVEVKDFSSGSYGTIFSEENLQDKRRVKQVPLAFYRMMPTALFSESEFPGWTFEFRQDGKEVDGENNCKDEDKSSKRQRLECS